MRLPGRSSVGRQSSPRSSASSTGHRTGPYALFIEGEAGIGKTTIWLEAVRAAEARATRVLKARPAESEANLSYAALADLVGAAFDELRGVLPPVQERSLAAALLRATADESAPARTTATALVSLLTAVAEREPVLLALDDVQWLDPASEEALAFAVRRLPPQLSLLVARRGEPGAELPLGLARALPEDRVERVAPAPLSLAALHELVKKSRRAVAVAPAARPARRGVGRQPVLRARDGARVRESSRRPRPRRAAPRSSQHRGARRRARRPAVRRLRGRSRWPPRRPRTRRRRSSPMRSEASWTSARRSVEAEEAGVLTVERDRIRFSHPLLASVIYGSASHERRRQLHKRLAVVVSDPEQRARHLALSTTEPDEATAAELEQAARQAARRGAQQAAAELFAASSRLTPADRAEDR